jgi:arsenate reductase-like glutaredoxin family protein
MKEKLGIKLSRNQMTEEELLKLYEKIDAGVKAAIAEAIEKHRRLGQSITIWRDGKIVTLTAAEIPPLSDNDTV